MPIPAQASIFLVYFDYVLYPFVFYALVYLYCCLCWMTITLRLAASLTFGGKDPESFFKFECNRYYTRLLNRKRRFLPSSLLSLIMFTLPWYMNTHESLHEISTGSLFFCSTSQARLALFSVTPSFFSLPLAGSHDNSLAERNNETYRCILVNR